MSELELAFGKLASVPAQAYLPRNHRDLCASASDTGDDFRENRGDSLEDGARRKKRWLRVVRGTVLSIWVYREYIYIYIYMYVSHR